MPYCYIIHSEHLDRFYTGICQDDISGRIDKHNSHVYGNHRFTSKATDWKLFVLIDSDSMSHARRIEQHIKKMKSSVYIRKLKMYPNLIERLKTRFKMDA